MNRTLRRPMFRIGGTAEGITSGLDQTQLTASRPGFFNGGNTPILDRTVKAYPKYHEALSKIRGRPRDTGLSDFLISTGLDLVSRPRAGNIFQQVATSAKGPYEQWSAMRSSRGAEEDKLSAALFGDVMDLETRKYEAQKKVEAEAAGKTDKQFDIGAPAKIDQLRKDSYNEKLRLENELAELKAKQNPSEEDLTRIQQIEKAELPAVQGTINDLEGAETTLQKIAQAGEDMQERFNDMIDELLTTTNPKTGEDYTQAEAIQEALRVFGTFFKSKGGRVGYQMGGAAMPTTVPAAMPMDQGAEQDSPVQDLSFEELRARLPQEITNDIVKLLSESKQALVDFANIRTQQDVNAFNQKYDVNLVVPQEA